MGDADNTMKPKLQPSKVAVTHCPFCGLGPFQDCTCNAEIECDEEVGGCGKKYRVIEVRK